MIEIIGQEIAEFESRIRQEAETLIMLLQLDNARCNDAREKAKNIEATARNVAEYRNRIDELKNLLKIYYQCL